MVQPKAGRKRTRTARRMEVCHPSSSCSCCPEKRFRALLNEGEERGDIRQHGQGLQSGTSTMKRTATGSGCQLQHLWGRCSYFPAKEVWCTHPSGYSPRGHREWETQPDDRWTGKTKVLSTFPVSVKPCSQTSACTSMVLGQRQSTWESNRLENVYIRWMCSKPECHMRHTQEY